MKRIKKHLKAKRNIKTLQILLDRYENSTDNKGLCYHILYLKYKSAYTNEQCDFIYNLLSIEAEKQGILFYTQFLWPTKLMYHRINWLNEQIETQKKQLIKFW